MMTSTDFTPFFRQLGYWSLHVPLNALPSFLIAYSLDMHLAPGATVAILLVVAAFVIALSAILAALPGLNEPERPFARALRLVMRVRCWICIPASLLLVFVPQSIFLIPDFWLGYLAAGFVDSVFFNGMHGLSPEGAHAVFLITTFEGLLLATGIAILTFFIGIELNARDRRKLFSAAGRP